MSREERRAYERMNKGRDPFAPPVSAQARQRMERQKQKRTARRTQSPAGSRSSRFMAVLLVGMVVVGLLAFSLAWPQGMPNALYVGVGAALTWLALAFLGRVLTRRAGAIGPPPPR
jgi:hypothetical protein